MNWIKNTSSALIAAGLAFLAFMAVNKARSHKITAKKWQDKAVESGNADVKEGVESASAALGQAKLHAAKAKEAKAQGKAKLDKIPDQDMAALVSGWRRRK